MPAFGIHAPNSRESLQIIATHTELLTDALGPVQPKQAVPFYVPIFVSFVLLPKAVSTSYLPGASVASGNQAAGMLIVN